MIEPTPNTEALVARLSKILIYQAIDRFIGECARQGLAESTRTKYRQILDPFGDTVHPRSPDEVTIDDCRAFLDRWVDASESTLALHVTVLRRFFAFCEEEEIVFRSPAEKLKRPRRKRPEDLDVVTVSSSDVRRMLTACGDWQEMLCVAVVFYMGVRRQAAANVRRRDVDLDLGVVRFREKGGKVIRKAIPDELLALLRRADELGQWLGPEEWLIPNRKPWLVKSTKRRGHKVIYETIVRVAERAGVRAHPHSLRAAFAVQFDEQHPDRVVDLKDALGHARIETTMTYLRRRQRSRAMETMRDVSLFPASGGTPPAGFEPAFQPSPLSDKGSPVTGGSALPDALLRLASVRADMEKRISRVSEPE